MSSSKINPATKDPSPSKPPTSTLFTPLQIRSLHLPNRIVVSPMGMYSSPDGHLTPFHLTHHGAFAFRRAALTIVEVTAVLPAGRSSPLDAGLWCDAQIPSFKRVVDYVHGLEGGTARIGIQLGHAGRKASMLPVYPGKEVERAEDGEMGGWPGEVVGASAVPFMENYYTPREMSVAEIEGVVEAFADAAGRAVEAGFDLIEIHAAHGYLLSSFLSPASNHRTDAYGGTLANRARFLLAVVHAIRARIPSTTAFSVRISAVDWMAHLPEEPQWTLADSIALALLLADAGVDILDVSSGSNNAAQQIPTAEEDAFYQVRLAAAIKAALGEAGKTAMLVAAVGRIRSAEMAERIVREGMADLCFVGIGFLREAGLVLKWQEQLGVEVEWPRQFVRAK